ncbi:transglycosylase SLT domain-containing protein [Kitasatospora sp. NPDC094028]
MPEGFRIAAAWVKVSPDLGGFREELQAKLSEATAGVEGRVRVTLDTAEFDGKAGEVKARLDELGGEHAEPSIHLEAAEFEAKADDARAKLEELGGKRADPSLRLEDAEFEAKVDDAEARIDRLSHDRARPDLELNTAEFEAKLERAEAQLHAFNARSASARLDAGGSGHGRGSGGEGGGLLGGLGEHSMMMPAIVGGITSLLPSIGGAAMGGGLLAGAGGLALGPVAKALGEAHQASLNIGMTKQQVAATQFSYGVQRQDAQEQVTTARMQQAQDAVTSARTIESAQMNLASVERSTAAQQVQALQSVVQAEQGVQQANYGLSEAQYNLNQAWERARENLRELDDQLADSKLSVQEAQLGIQQALYQQKLTDENAYSTQLDRQQAALAVAQAQQRLVDAQDQLTASQYKANLANQEGIDGSQEIIKAKQAVVTAQYGQIDSQAQFAIAQQNLTNTQLNDAAQVKEARMQLAAAEEDAAYRRQMDARSVALAERNVGNVIQEQQLQWAAMKSTENEAANQLARDLARMTPAMRGVFEQVLGMSGAFEGMKQAAQNAVAPGLSQFFTGLAQSMPSLTSGVSAMGTVIGQIFGSIGKALQSQDGQNVLQGLIDNGLQLAKTVGPAIGGLLGALAQLGAQKGAADGLGGAVAGIATSLTNVVKAVGPFVGPLSSALSTLGQALAPIGTLLGTVVGQAAQALAPVLAALLPAVTTLAGALGQGLSPIFQALGPLLLPVAQAITGVVQAFSPLLPVIGDLIGQVGKDLTPLFQALVPVVVQLAQFLVKDLQAGLLQTFQAILPLIPVAAKFIESLLPLVSLVLKIGGILVDFAAKLIGPVISAIVSAASAILNFASHWRDAVDWVEDKASWLWHHVFEPLWKGIRDGADDFVTGFKKVWDTLEDAFKHPVSFLINTVYDGGIAKLWNTVTGAIGMHSLDLPIITGFASGGIVPGYAPGQDTVPAMLSPGEGVLVPEAVQAIGPDTVRTLNATYGGGRSSTGTHFSGGGIVGGITHFVGGLIDKVSDIAKITAALATGNGEALTNALAKLVGTKDAVGNYAKLLLGVPTSLIHSMVQAILGAHHSAPSGGGAIPSGDHLTIIDAALQAAGVPPPGTQDEWRSGLNTLITRESGWNPRAINNTDINAQNGDPSRGLAQTIMSTFLSNHVAGTSTDIYDPVANVAAAIHYIVSRYGSISRVQQANPNLPPKGYDRGGWLMPGTMPVNGLARPEAVLTPDQSQAFITLARHLAGQGPGGASVGRQVTVEQHYHGTQLPTVEQQADMQRRLTLALSGA